MYQVWFVDVNDEANTGRSFLGENIDYVTLITVYLVYLEI